MRELKFRSWKKHYGKLRRCVFSPFGLIEYAQKHPEAPVLHNEDVNDIRDFMPNADFIEQYTGLKDKNGKEIYEGDIVEKDGINYWIKWEDGCFVIWRGEKNISFVFGSHVSWCEVIGNIHENPELLEKE